MDEGLQAVLKKHLHLVDGLRCISVSDRDGVQIVEVHTDHFPTGVIKPIFMGTFAIASEQASKLGVGKNTSIISYYSGYQVIQFNYLPFVLTFIADSKSNTGMLYSLEEDLRDPIGHLQAAVSVP
ncbi:PREDICTED: ragulator complex protein LAMTOR3-A-like [Amphimedon queenslandica]|uniref:Ragulator complex protein LAMTOR3 n=1 Tax=Amphimedon queenslandica TaxID=400682 RepID=A0A1X7VTZ0_AMPQE|nr:PREDICTED: ragulator complex protein LAMTOR3-A-like [Amphimedon queenslandica]|eukprot:XP_003382803.1 PREDICTED: ragulator complex protein LAMTOR3-A-like [Amphimedon queenslandica]